MSMMFSADMPPITSSTMNCATYAGEVIASSRLGITGIADGVGHWNVIGGRAPETMGLWHREENLGGYVVPHEHKQAIIDKLMQSNRSNQIVASTSRSIRLVQVHIIDPDERLPLDKAVLYKGESVLTDKTDNELFFDLNVAQLVADHNKVREATEDKKASAGAQRIQFLEPARIRDLKMAVTTIATFA